MRRLFTCGSALAVCCAVLIGLPAPATATFIGQNGRIFYSTFGQDTGNRIHSIEPDGTGHRVLTTGYDVTVSPDGARIAFLDTVSGEDDTELFTAWADGTHRRRVTTNNVQERSPSFDSRAIAGVRPYRFRLVVVSGGYLKTIDPRTGEGRKLSPLADVTTGSVLEPGGTDVAAGEGIAFLRDEEDPYEHGVWSIDRDGSGLRQLTDDDRDTEPEFGPDSQRVYFVRNNSFLGGFSDTDLFTMNRSGGDQEAVFDTDAFDEGSPAPSPDGTDLAFTRKHTDNILFRYRLMVRFDGGPGHQLVEAQEPGEGVNSVEWQAKEPPQHAILSAPPPVGNDPTPRFSFTSDEVGTTFFCRLDRPGGPDPYLPCGSGGADGRHAYTIPDGLADGIYTMTLASEDLSGARDPNPASVEFEIDTDPPETGFSSGPLDGATVDTDQVTFGFGATENGATLQCRTADTTYQPCTSPTTLGPLSDGTHTFLVRAVDAAGNADPTPAQRTFTIVGGDPPPVEPAPTCRGRAATIVADSGARVIGTRGRDVIVGTPGQDVINARGGADLVCAGGGRDVVRGAGGRDRLYGQGGPDRLGGGSGSDRLFGQGGRDRLQGGSGNDRLVGGAKQDRCRGGKGRDRNRGC